MKHYHAHLYIFQLNSTELFAVLSYIICMWTTILALGHFIIQYNAAGIIGMSILMCMMAFFGMIFWRQMAKTGGFIYLTPKLK